MITLIIPCCGRNFINNKPRWSLNFPNKSILLTECINKINYELYDRIIVTILADDISLLNECKRNNMFSEKIEFCILNALTSGPAETVANTISQMHITGEIQIKDIDILFRNNEKCRGNFIAGTHLINYDSSIKNIKNKSFITRNEQNSVMDIIEKIIKSDIISIGLYGFSNAESFVKVFNRLNKLIDKGSSLYISHIISYMIGVHKIVFNFVEIENFETIETQKDYEKIIRSKGTYVFDLNNSDYELCVDDLYGLYKNGARLIFIASTDNKILNSIKQKGILFTLIESNKDDYVKMITNSSDLKDVFYNAS